VASQLPPTPTDAPSRRSRPVDRGWFSTIDQADHLVGTHPARWGIGDALLGLLIAQVANVVAALVYLGISGRDSLDDLSVTVLVLLQLSLWVGYGLWPVYVSTSKGSGLARDFGWRVKSEDTYQGVLFGVALQLLGVSAIYLFLMLFFGDLDVGDAARELTDLAVSPFDLVLLGLIVVVGAPVVEELFFRGLVLRSLERRWGSKVAIAVSSVVFAGVHFQVVQFPALLMFGLVAGWLTVRSGRLGPAIFAHVGFNGVTMVILVAEQL
jgi:membrane protease YdiL (CAAX protease family)